MNVQTGFQDLMQSLWNDMEIDLPSGTASEIYSILFANDVEVHLLGTQAGMVDIISEAGILRDRHAGPTLLKLIALNRPPLSVNFDEDSGAVTIWTRQRIDALDIDALIAIITNLVNTVHLAAQCIDGKEAREIFNPAVRYDTMYVPSRQEATFTHLRRRN